MQHIVSITDKCNLNCPYCHSKVIRKLITSKKDLVNCLEELKKKGVAKIDFSGGEPTLVEELPDYIKIARKYFDVLS